MKKQLFVTTALATLSTNRSPIPLRLLAIASTAVLIGVISVWTVYRCESTLQTNVDSKLKTILAIESEAIHQWLESEKHLAKLLCSTQGLADLMLEEGSDIGLGNDPLNHLIYQIASNLENKTCFLFTSEGRVVASSEDNYITSCVERPGNQFWEPLLADEPSVSKLLEQNEPGNNQLSLIVAAPIQHPTNGTVGFLGIRYNAASELTRVLASSRAGETGESLAVTKSGDLISASRFLEGGSNLEVVSDILPDDFQTGGAQMRADLSGHVDHRGVEAAYVARWMPSLGIALVTKMDLSEAFAPVYQIRRFIWTLCILLLLTTIAATFYRWYVYRLRVLAKQHDLDRKRLGAYELEDKVGEGGMGVVFKARHALLRRPTAIKILPPEKSSKTSIERFEREVQSTSRLKHPNTISIYDYGRTEGGLFYYAMELLDGLNLEQLVDRDGPLPDGRVLQILRQVCESLREAHSLGLIHRDIKPANIMLCDRGGAFDTVKVLDFGMVRDSGGSMDFCGALSGTPTYMAPECFNDPTKLDPRVDLFAVGAVGFFLLTGSPLLELNSLSDLMKLHNSDFDGYVKTRLQALSDIPNSQISQRLIQLLMSCVSADREDRVHSVERLLSELSQCDPVQSWSEECARNWWLSVNSTELLQTSADLNSSCVLLDTTQTVDSRTLELANTKYRKFAWNAN